MLASLSLTFMTFDKNYIKAYVKLPMSHVYMIFTFFFGVSTKYYRYVFVVYVLEVLCYVAADAFRFHPSYSLVLRYYWDLAKPCFFISKDAYYGWIIYSSCASSSDRYFAASHLHSTLTRIATYLNISWNSHIVTQLSYCIFVT